MTKRELQKLSNYELLELYEDFVKWSHYEAVNEFDRLRELNISYYEVQDEVKRRMVLE